VKVKLGRMAQNAWKECTKGGYCPRSIHLVIPTAILALYVHKALRCLISNPCTLLPSIHHPFWISVPYAYQTRMSCLPYKSCCKNGSVLVDHLHRTIGGKPKEVGTEVIRRGRVNCNSL
jgi:hypothetical protein